MASLRVLSLAVIGKHGNPLFVKSYSTRRGGEADLKWHYAAHMALDYFEERELPGAKTTEQYLGLLYTMEDYAIYGYQTNTRVKFVIALAMVDTVVRDLDVKTLFRAMHNAYIAYLGNPFYIDEVATDSLSTMAPTITSKKFNAAMDAIAGEQAVTAQPTSKAIVNSPSIPK